MVFTSVADLTAAIETYIDETVSVLADLLADGDLLLMMGAGDIGYVAADLAAHGIHGEHQA